MTTTAADQTSQVKYETIEVTPDVARELLKQNTSNRKVHATAVAAYSSDMSNGRWKFTADPIRIDTDGVLLDGQHRLMAVAKQDDGFSTPMLVVSGLPSESQKVMDQGARRTAGDQLGLAGVKNASTIAAAVRLVILYDARSAMSRGAVSSALSTTAAVEEWVEANPSAIADAQVLYRDAVHCLGRKSANVAAAIVIAREWGADKAGEFFDMLANGGAPRDSAINALDQRLRRNRENKVRTSNGENLAFVIKAFNMWVVGRDMRKMIAPLGGWTNANFPSVTTRDDAEALRR